MTDTDTTHNTTAHDQEHELSAIQDKLDSCPSKQKRNLGHATSTSTIEPSWQRLLHSAPIRSGKDTHS
jgi:hypothetical protein